MSDKLANRKQKMGGNPQGADDGEGGLLIDGYRRQSKKPAFRPNGDLPEDVQKQLGGYMANGSVIDRAEGTTGTSIFDPVLCELMYTWFCPPSGLILDPFAGGSVRGIVAAVLGRYYVGLDLRPEQVEENRTQAERITPDNIPAWLVGNSLKLPEFVSDEVDFVFSCPPYYDLEIYSDDSDDLSTYETYEQFIEDYRAIIAHSLSLLKDNRFACFVVGDIRDKKGFYRCFVRDTINAFQDCGALLYNDAVLITAVGSLPIRVGRQFGAGRKLGKGHQNVLVFCKGDPKAATEAVGEIEIWEPEDTATMHESDRPD